MKTIILINGPKRSGKNYLAEIMQSLTKDSAQFSIAQPAKNIIAKSLGITPEELENFKDNEDEFGLELKVYPNNQPQGTIAYLSFRQLLQNFAVDSMMESFGDTVWATKCIDDIIKSDSKFSFVTDFRFPFEFNVFREIADRLGFKVITIHIFNDDLELTDTHSSETSMKGFEFDYTINNTGQPKLKKIAKLIIESIKNKNLD